MVKIHNLKPYAVQYEYIVARLVENPTTGEEEFWFWGADDDPDWVARCQGKMSNAYAFHNEEVDFSFR